MAGYVDNYAKDFVRKRQIELPFEVPVNRAVISGAVDLILSLDDSDQIRDASVIDFKIMEDGDEPTNNPDRHWENLSLQVQLYARGAIQVYGMNARTGAVHLLKDGQRVSVPVDADAVDAAVTNVNWAVGRIIAGDFPQRLLGREMRPLRSPPDLLPQGRALRRNPGTSGTPLAGQRGRK
ncbi:hypothetical protein [Streptomyces sp. enrichment culture]|uniref:hypothetical protein n=1 Tax=Streptomyces sp. enrichment culture TaxID=1795815 RepID=UPI003F575908